MCMSRATVGTVWLILGSLKRGCRSRLRSHERLHATVMKFGDEWKIVSSALPTENPHNKATTYTPHNLILSSTCRLLVNLHGRSGRDSDRLLHGGSNRGPSCS